MSILTVRKGDAVNYRDPVQPSVIHHATCTGHGRKNGERILYLDDGHWCNLSQVASVAKGTKRQQGQRSSRISTED